MTHALRALAALLLLLTFSTPAMAQRVSVSDGIATPHPTIVDRDDSQALELNPAGLAHIDGLDMSVLYTAVSDDIGEGTGGLIAVGSGGFGFGYGLQFVGPGVTESAYRKHTLGFGFGDEIALGLNYNFLGSDARDIDNHSSWDLGLQWRMLRWFGFGLRLRDADTPFLRGDSVDPTLVLGAAVRGLSGRWSLEADVTLYGGSSRTRPSLSLAIEPIEGLRVFGTALADTGPEGTDFEVVRFLSGMSIDFGNIGAQGAGIYGDSGNGVSAAAHVSTSSYRSLFAGPKRFYIVTLRGDLPERAPRDFLGRRSGGSFLGLVQQLRRMGEDPTVQGIVLDMQGLTAGYGQLWELRQEIARLRERGITVVAYLHTTGQREYYLAAAAQKVYMGPSVLFSPSGLALTLGYYRGALDKLGVEPQFLKIAEYKSAPESFERTGPTEPAIEAHSAFLDSIWNHQLEAIGNDRGLGTGALADLIDNVPYTPAEAQSAGLIDGVFYYDELETSLREQFGDGVSLSKQYGRTEKDYTWGDPPAVVVLYVDGNIVGGEGGANPLLGGLLVGSTTIERVADWAARNPRVKAVVLRVDSPGGSAVASDLMYRALRKLRDKKPLIISMGDVAASGGYYVAAAGQKIYCDPTTLTGSIGIFTGKFALNGLFEKVGYSTFTNKRGERSDLFTLDRPWTEEEKIAVRHQIEYLYELFLGQISAGRDMERDAIDAVGRGRIWSGVDALNKGLCDQHGGIMDAVLEAAELGGVDPDDMTVAELPVGTALSPIAPILASVDAELTVPMPDDSAELAALRILIEPLRPAADLALLYADGEPLALLPFRFE